MPAPARTRRSAQLFASSCLVVAGLFAGCDTETGQADKTVAETLRASNAKRGGEAVAELQKASQTANASPGATAHAKTLLAQAKLEQARQTIAGVELDEISVSRLVSEIEEIGVQIQNNNAIIASSQQISPKGSEALAKQLEADRGKVTGKAPEDVWKLEGGQLPALSNAQGRAGKISPQIKDLESKKADLVKQRETAELKAAESLRASKRKTGKESLELFKSSVAESKKSAELATQIGTLDHRLTKLKQDLALAQAQSQQLDATVKGLGDRLGQNDKSTAKLAELVKSHQALSESLVNGDASESKEPAPTTSGAPSPIVTNATMAAKAKELSTLAAEIDTKRKAAAELITAAIGHYDAALADLAKARTDIEKNLRDSNVNQYPQAAAWKAIAAVYSPGSLNLQKANAQQMLAGLHRDAVGSLAARRQMDTAVGATLKEASIQAPAELADANLDTQFTDNQKAATEAYDAADTVLQEVIDGANIDDVTRNGAQTAQVIAWYGRAQLLRAAGDAAAADAAIAKARQTVTTGTLAAEQYPSYIRVSLGLMKAPTTGPTTAPAAAATTAPAAAVTTAPATATEAAPASEPTEVDPAAMPTEGAPATTPATAPAAG